jgi:type I restriction enzyme S subunit
VKVVPFDQAAIPQSDKGKRLKQRDYLQEGSLAVIDQGQQQVGGYTDDQTMAFEGELPVVLFGDHTRSVKLVNHSFAVGADGIKIFRPAEGVRTKYLFYWMKGAPIPDRGYGRHYQFLRQLSVPLPSEDEQDEIVAELEKQFSRLDEAVANLQRVKANLKRYKASVLKAAVEGRLVETEATLARREGRTYETGEQLLQRILEERRAKWTGKGKYKEPTAPDTVGFNALPGGWIWASGDQLTSVITDGEHITPRRTSEGVLLLSARNVLNGRLALDDVDYVPEDEYERIAKRIAIQAGDVLLSCSGTVGRSCVVPAGLRFTLVRSVAVLRPVIMLADFMTYNLQSPLGQSQIDDRKTQTAQANLFQGKIRQLVFALPPLAEQARIVAEVDRHLSIVSEVEAEVDTNLKRAQALRQATLAKAFAN